LPGRSLGLVPSEGRLGGQFAVVAGGRAGRRLPGWVGPGREPGDRAERGERGRGEQDVVEAAGGAGRGGVGDVAVHTSTGVRRCRDDSADPSAVMSWFLIR
jgi:hypothetical protein